MLYHFITNAINPGPGIFFSLDQLAYMRGDVCWHVGQLFSHPILFTFSEIIEKKESVEKDKKHLQITTIIQFRKKRALHIPYSSNQFLPIAELQHWPIL